ncbi:MAG: enoyl-CoA hydratase [Betaproteobacteria bacterium]
MPISPSQAPEPMLLRHDVSGVCTLTLNRPDQFNSLSLALVRAVRAALDAIACDPTVRVVVLAGAGRAFCAGHDLKEMRAHPDLAFQQTLFRECGDMMVALTRLPQPVIARVHGVATAAGCQLVAQCDLAIASESARFAVSGINLGLYCATPSVALVRNIGRKAAFEMLATGDFIDAPRALQWGLVNRVVAAAALDESVAELAGKLAGKVPEALAAGKQLFYRQLEMGLAGAYQAATETIAQNMMSPATQQGIDAFIDKRPRG